MTLDPQHLIDAYLDDTISDDEQSMLCDWIKADPDHAKVFAHAVWLHDQLHNTLAAGSFHPVSPESNQPEPTSIWSAGRFLSASYWGATLSVTGLLLCMAGLWFAFGPSSASAAFRELDRIIVSTKHSKDRTYAIVVEDVVTPNRRGKTSNESGRPPKPPLDGATLHLREGQRFVLIRKTSEGLPFVTGSNGSQSWAVNARGAVRVSEDINHFNHDLPGHETSIPLTNIEEGLDRLKKSYELQFNTTGPEEYDVQGSANVRSLMAVKKPKVRGPQRVEIAYESNTGRILHMRFIGMPYGPDRLDLRLSLVSEDELPLDFFEHTNHHSPDRKIEMEK